MEKFKQKYGWLIENGFVFLVFLLFAALWVNIGRSLNYDLVWCFHISQKVADGYLLYSEISTVVTPLYFWFGSLFIKIFGNALTSMNIYGGFVWGVTAVTLYNIVKLTKNKNMKLVFPLTMMFLIQYSAILAFTNYNSFAVMWALIAAYIEIRRETKNESYEKNTLYNILIGIFLGITFFSKQNIGFFGVAATGIFSIYKWIKTKESTLKEIFAKALGFLFVCLGMLIYFIFTNTFLDFINYCFGGLFEFGTENFRFYLSPKYAYLTAIIIVALLIANEKNDKILIFEIIFQLIMCGLSYPLTNNYHVILSLLMSLPIMVRLMHHCSSNKIIYYILVLFFTIWTLYLSTSTQSTIKTDVDEILTEESNRGEIYSLFMSLFLINFGIGIASEKEKISTYVTAIIIVGFVLAEIGMYKDMIKDEYVAEGLEVYENLGYTEKQLGYIKTIVDYIKQKEAEGNNVYVVSADASYYMIALRRNNYKFDLTLYGSLGIEGEDGLIEDVSKLKNAILLKSEELMHQEPQKFDQYIKDNYEVIDHVGKMAVYAVK